MTKTAKQDQHQANISNLWIAMQGLFGVKWTGFFGEAVDATGQWSKTLEGVSSVQMAHGLNKVRTSGREAPPSAPEFRGMCLWGDRPQQRMPQFSPPRPKLTSEQMEQAVAELAKEIELSAEAIIRNYKPGSDGYELARELENDTRDRITRDQMECLDAVDSLIREAEAKLVKEWVAAHNIEAELRLQDRAVFRAQGQLYAGKVIDVRDEDAKYAILNDGDPHTTAYIVKYEHACAEVAQ